MFGAKMVTENLIFSKEKTHNGKRKGKGGNVHRERVAMKERNVLQTRNYGFSKRHLYEADTQKMCTKRFDKRT